MTKDQKTEHEKDFRKRVLAFMGRHGLTIGFIAHQVGFTQHPRFKKFIEKGVGGITIHTEGKIIAFMEEYDSMIQEGRPIRISQFWKVINGKKVPLVMFKKSKSELMKRADRKTWLDFVRLGWMPVSDELREWIEASKYEIE